MYRAWHEQTAGKLYVSSCKMVLEWPQDCDLCAPSTLHLDASRLTGNCFVFDKETRRLVVKLSICFLQRPDQSVQSSHWAALVVGPEMDALDLFEVQLLERQVKLAEERHAAGESREAVGLDALKQKLTNAKAKMRSLPTAQAPQATHGCSAPSCPSFPALLGGTSGAACVNQPGLARFPSIPQAPQATHGCSAPSCPSFPVATNAISESGFAAQALLGGTSGALLGGTSGAASGNQHAGMAHFPSVPQGNLLTAQSVTATSAVSTQPAVPLSLEEPSALAGTSTSIQQQLLYMQQYQQMLVNGYDAGSSPSIGGGQGLQSTVDASKALAEMNQLEDKVKEAEEKVKRAASQSHHYVGLISKFDTLKGYGFVSCPETFKRFGRDIFIDRESYQGARIGDTVVFSVGFNKKGEVRACDVQKLNEVTRLKQELQQKKQVYMTSVSRSGMNVQTALEFIQGNKRPAPADDGPSFKRFARYQQAVFLGAFLGL
eukprot:s1306_g33.t5